MATLAPILLICTLALGLMRSAEAGATLEIKLNHYYNTAGKDADGRPCDYFDNCDHDLHFCLHDLINSDHDMNRCRYVDEETGRLSNKNENDFSRRSAIGGVSNPIVVHVNSWPEQGLRLKVKVRDDDTLGPEDDVDFFSNAIKPPITPMNAGYGPVLALEGTRPNHKTTLEIQLHLYCDRNYYGSRCDVYCTPHDDRTSGHYTCNSTTGGKICIPGWEDPYNDCKVWADDCSTPRCRNGGTCIDLYKDYSCECPLGFTGRKCEIQVDHCDPDPCKNGGRCSSEKTEFVCHCPDQFVGATCAYDICNTANSCENGGVCVGLGQCYCVNPAFTGQFCETEICETLECENGGACHLNKCLCPVGYTGVLCEQSIDKCLGVVCQHGGTCRDGACQCKPGYKGTNCQFIVNFCIDEPCLNDGDCYIKSTADGYFCSCADGYTGGICDKKITTTTTTTAAATNTATEFKVPTRKDQTVREPNSPELLASEEKEKNGLPWYIWVAIGGAVILVIAIIIIALIVSRNKKREKKLKNTILRQTSETSADSFDNPIFQVDNVYENTPGSTGFAPLPPIPQQTQKNVNLNIVPRHMRSGFDTPRVHFDAPQTDAHGSRHPEGATARSEDVYSVPRKSKTARGGLKTPTHLEERYNAMRKASLTDKKI